MLIYQRVDPLLGSLILSNSSAIVSEMWRLELEHHFDNSRHHFEERRDPIALYSDSDFVQRHRFNKEQFAELLDIVGPSLERSTRSRAVLGRIRRYTPYTLSPRTNCIVYVVPSYTIHRIRYPVYVKYAITNLFR